MNRNRTLVLLGVGALGVFALGWYLTAGSSQNSSQAPQNAVNPNAQIGVGGPFAAQGTMPDIGNLLSYNQLPGVMSAPQATSVATGLVGDYATTTAGATNG